MKNKKTHVILNDSEGSYSKNKEDSLDRDSSPSAQNDRSTKYFPQDIESKWQKIWKGEGLYKFESVASHKSQVVSGRPTTYDLRPTTKGKYYTLVELPYPSGDLHIGHWFTFVAPDVLSRFKRMQGYQVFFPMGYDAFGLPAENAAIKRGVHPQDWTLKNIETMTKQFETMGTCIDWDHVTVTCLPEYYTWNQWIFEKMYQKGLAYRGKTLSNWCPVDQTVLANEHVENGKCWRCGAEVVQKEVEQWFLKITDYAEKLLWPDLHPSPLTLNASNVDWPKSVMVAQNDWIGKKVGMKIKHKIVNSDISFETFTAYPAWSWADSYIVIAPEHPLVEKLVKGTDHEKEVMDFVHEISQQTELERKETTEKKGVFTGRYAKDPFGGPDMPIWLANFALMNFGTGIIRCSGHDERDIAFAKKYDIPTKEVVDKRESGVPATPHDGQGGILHDSGPFTGKDVLKVREEIMDWIEEQGIGKRFTNYHLHDWSVSRQRYWGTPVPFVYCFNCYKNRHPEQSEGSHPHVIASGAKQSHINKEIATSSHQGGTSRNDKEQYGITYTEIDGENYAMIPVPLDQLPVTLPYDVDYQPKGKAPLASNEQWMKTTCPRCGGQARRDPETLDTFFDSSWYYYRYVNPQYDKGPFNPEQVKELMPVDIYFGGGEHTLGHTLYARFFTKFFKDLGLVDFDEFALKRVQHGIVLGQDGNKMSKSKGNVINPDDVVKEFGTDAVRVYLSFMMPYSATGPWSTTAMYGSYRFLKRVWELQYQISNIQYPISNVKSSVIASPNSIGAKQSHMNHPELNEGSQSTDNLSTLDLHHMHKTIKKVTDDIEQNTLNTAIAALMEWLNYLEGKGERGKGEVSKEEYHALLLLLAPFAPHMTEEIWQRLKGKGESVKGKEEPKNLHPSPFTLHPFHSVHLQPWPTYDEKYLVADEVTIAVQVNGKLRDTLVIASEAKQSQIEEAARKSEKISKHLEGKTVKKVIYVPGKILNFVM